MISDTMLLILKIIYENPDINESDLKAHFSTIDEKTRCIFTTDYMVREKFVINMVESSVDFEHVKVEAVFRLLPKGEALYQRHLTETKGKKTESLRFWVAIIISNLIALAALIISMISIL